MIIKFCFQNEIHRCSDPPSDFSLLQPFLTKMFQSNLPRNFVLSYLSPEGESFPLSSHEDYEALQNKEYNKPIRVIITEVLPEDTEKVEENDEDDRMSEYDMIAAEDKKVEDVMENKPEEVQREMSEKKELKDLLEEITEEVTKVHVVPKVQKLEGEIPNEEQVKRIVREALAEQMPFIVERIKGEGSMQESLRSVQSDYVPEQKKSVQYNWNQMALYPYYQSILQSIPDEMKVAQSQAQSQKEDEEERNPYLPVPEMSDAPQEKEEEGSPTAGEEEGKVKERSPSILKKVKKAFVEFPGKVEGFVDNLAHKISGDPLVQCEEGKYPKSVVAKVEELKQVFEEADKKELLEFVSKLPKEFPIFQVADLWAMKNMDDEEP